MFSSLRTVGKGVIYRADLFSSVSIVAPKSYKDYCKFCKEIEKSYICFGIHGLYNKLKYSIFNEWQVRLLQGYITYYASVECGLVSRPEMYLHKDIILDPVTYIRLMQGNNVEQILSMGIEDFYKFGVLMINPDIWKYIKCKGKEVVLLEKELDYTVGLYM